VQTQRFHFYRSEYDALIDRLGNRLVDLYEQGEPSALEVVFNSKSVTDLVDQAQVIESLGAQDTSIAAQVGGAKERVKAQREHTRRASKADALQNVKESKSEFLHEAAGLQAASASLAAQIRSAQSASSYSAPSDTTPSAAGFIWPVNGPVTSGFGMRWGRMHEGINIGVGYGTPIHAAAAGRVVYAGWMSGTATSSRSTKAVTSRPPTVTSRRSRSRSDRSSRTARRSATSAAPGTASGRTCTSRCASAARPSTRSDISS
jgi:murein DD-endopeptidase MepM/ murein hydrolase activator NlpD